MSRHFSLTFDDLRFEAQQDWIDEIKKELLVEAEEAGKKFLKKDWYDPKPETWQEAYIRTYSNYDKDGIEPWIHLLDSYLEKKAEELCHEGMKHTEVEVEI